MAFGISGFGALQLSAAPQIFQALSLGGKPPVPPAPPYGTPNPNLVPVTQTGNPAVPANLTLVAHPTFQAILKVTSQTVLQFGHPPIASPPNTTTGVGATNPAVANQVQGPAPNGNAGGNVTQGTVSFTLTTAPASETSGVDALEETIAGLQQSEQAILAADANPPASSVSTNPNNSVASGNAGYGASGGSTAGSSGTGTGASAPAAPAPVAKGSGGSGATTPAAASPGLVSKIVQTVQRLAIGAIYSAPVFSFTA
jgi:hypothetical protein